MRCAGTGCGWRPKGTGRPCCFTEFDPRIRLEFLERSGSFSHVEEPEAVFALVRDFTGQ
jgi:hypothetical protein